MFDEFNLSYKLNAEILNLLTLYLTKQKACIKKGIFLFVSTSNLIMHSRFIQFEIKQMSEKGSADRLHNLTSCPPTS